MSVLPSDPLPALEGALAELEALCQGRSNATVRVGLRDGRQLEGSLIGASSGHLALAESGTPFVHRIVAAEIRNVELSVPRRGREWGLAVVGIVGMTGALVAVSLIPGMGAARLHLGSVFRLLFLLVAGLGSMVLARTRKGGWFTRWGVLYRAEGD